MNNNGTITDDICTLKELTQDTLYYTRVCEESKNGSVSCSDTVPVKTKNIIEPTIEVDTNKNNIVKITYDDSNIVEGNAFYYFKSTIDGISNINVSTCRLNDNKYTCNNDSVNNITKDTWYRTTIKEISITYNVPVNITITAETRDKSNNSNSSTKEFSLHQTTFTITYDNNGGSGCTTKTVASNSQIGSLCTPSRTGYTFIGWYNLDYKDNPLNYYADTYSDLYNVFGYDADKLYNHYLTYGINEGRRISQYISTDVFNYSSNKTIYAGWKIIKKPIFIASDGQSSATWHKNNFNLTLTSTNDNNDVDYFYGTSENNITTRYSSQINVKNNTTFYAKTCLKSDNTNCSEVTTYVAKIDKNPPIVEITLKNTSTGATISSNKYSSNKDNSLPWLPYHVTINYKFRDNETGINISSAIFKYNYELQQEINDSDVLVEDNISILNGSTYYNRSIGSDGDRKIYFKICDEADNCTENYTYFRTDVDKPNIYIDNDSDLNNDIFRFKCDSLSGISNNVNYQDGITRFGLVAYGQFGYKIPEIDNNPYIDYWYNYKDDIYAMCTNKAGTCSKIKAKIVQTTSGGCKLGYGTMPYINGFSTSNPCSTTEYVCGYPKFFGCSVYDGLIHYKYYYSDTSIKKEFVVENIDC